MLNVLRPVIGRHQTTFALNACPSANDAVVKRLQKRSLAVLLAVNNASGPNQCTLTQIVQAYGRPNSSATITGTLANPKEVLLFYDDGPELSGPVHPISPPQAPATIVPITFATLPQPSCAGTTILTVVAHQDDDLLFMNPDHLREARNGDCLRTVYLTAGDAGSGSSYWLGREKGAEAAYDAMASHGPSLWIERYVKINAHEYIRMASPRGNARLTLVFVRLPDGGVTGDGFSRTRFQSLARLESGAIPAMTSVDRQSSYAKDDLANLLVNLMLYYKPGQIDTQTPVNESDVHPDHSDHMAAGRFTEAAYSIYSQGEPSRDIPVQFYTGYPVDQLPRNVTGQDLADKSAAYYAYAVHDNRVCQMEVNCTSSPYSQWLEREYTYTP
jgi:LmbE family N-acetylglucosaminyl deacetylase